MAEGQLRELARSLIAPIPHRGPDGSGIFVGRGVALAHRRLAIIDLSEDGAQPMRSGDGRLVLTYNGEIYNYIEIRDELKSLGVAFRTQSDSEVILAAYAQWGRECVRRFNGMWSFVIYDQDRRRIFGSRDRFGVKPLYYVQTGGMLVLASEIRQLLPLLPAVRANVRMVTEFLLTCFSDYEEHTYFDGVRRVPAGHSFSIDLASPSIEFERHYRVAVRPELQELDPADAVSRFRQVFCDAVRLRMRADVRVGTCLSGGVDSSSVAAVASGVYREATSEPFCAITAVSEQGSNDESEYAQQVVERSGLRWLKTRPTYSEFVECLDDVVRAQEEPFASPSINMQYFVMRTAKEHGIKVLLDGQGGDETLLGYEKYYAAYFAALARRNGYFQAICGLWACSRNNAHMGVANTLKFLVGGLSPRARFAVYRHRHAHVRYDGQIPWFMSALGREIANDFGLQLLEIEHTNLPVLLRYEDKNSMAHSIETRLPFLDYRVVETALSLPIECKMRSGWTKWVLREAIGDYLPREIAWRRNKMGFEAPERLWLARHDAVMRDTVLASPLISLVTQPERIRRSWFRLDRRYRWRLYSVAKWEREFAVI
jgi:asparagine synthase (glutamine-hydrolysing)